MSDVVMRANGLGGHVELLTDRVRITRHGLRAFLGHGFRGNREVLLADLSSIAFKDAGTTNGYIKFACCAGGAGSPDCGTAESDELVLGFTAAQAEPFGKLMTHLEAVTQQCAAEPTSDESELLPAVGRRPPSVPFNVATTREMASTSGGHSGWLHHIPANLSHRATIIGIAFGLVYVVSMVVLSNRGFADPADARVGFADDLQRRMDSMASGFHATVSGPDGTTLQYEVPTATYFLVDEWAMGIMQQGGVLEVATLERLGFEQLILSDSTGELGRWTVDQLASHDGS